MPALRLWPRGPSSPRPGLHISLHQGGIQGSCSSPSASHPQCSTSAPVSFPVCPILEWDPRFRSADFSLVSLSCYQDPISSSASNVLVYAFVLTGVVGLALSYALSFTNLLSGLISSFTLTETMMVSVERTEEYTTDIPMEPQNKLVQVKAQIYSPELAHLLALCSALASWGDHRVPVDGWRALTHRNRLDLSSFTGTSRAGDETLAGVSEVWNNVKG